MYQLNFTKSFCIIDEWSETSNIMIWEVQLATHFLFEWTSDSEGLLISDSHILKPWKWPFPYGPNQILEGRKHIHSYQPP